MRRRDRVSLVRSKITLRAGIGAGVAVAVPASGALLAAAPALATPDPAPSPTPSTGTAPRPVLSIGSRGEAVKAIQSRLGVNPTGFFGAQTLSFVKNFQRVNGLVADGVMGPLTWSKMMGASTPTSPSVPTRPTTPSVPATPSTPTDTTSTTCTATATTLKYGSTHQLVKVLQSRLGLVVDGWFGPLTRTKVIAFQRSNGLIADGVVGPLTWAKLGCSDATPSVPSTSIPTTPTVPGTPTTPTVPTSPTVPTTPSTDTSATAAQIIAFAKTFTGTRYVWGGSKPGGFDCSGLTSYVFKQFGYTMPRTSAQQQAYFPRTTNPQPGDLLFYGYPAYHVAIYLGDGMMFDAPNPSATVGVRKIYGTPSGYARVIR